MFFSLFVYAYSGLVRCVVSPSLDLVLSPDRDTLADGNGLGVGVLGLVGIEVLSVLSAGLALEETALLDGAAGLDAGDGAVVSVLGDVGTGASVDGGGQVGDVLGDWVLGAHSAGVDSVTFAGLGHGVVARVEVLAVLEMLGEVVGTGGELAVETEETLLLGGEGLNSHVSIQQLERSDT